MSSLKRALSAWIRTIHHLPGSEFGAGVQEEPVKLGSQPMNLLQRLCAAAGDSFVDLQRILRADPLEPLMAHD